MRLRSAFEQLCFHPYIHMQLFFAHIANRCGASGRISQRRAILPPQPLKEHCVVEEAVQLVEGTRAQIGLVCQFAVGIPLVEQQCTVQQLVVAVGRSGSQIIFYLFGHLFQQSLIDGERNAKDSVHPEVLLVVRVIEHRAVCIDFHLPLGIAESNGSLTLHYARFRVHRQVSIHKLLVVQLLLRRDGIGACCVIIMQ